MKILNGIISVLLGVASLIMFFRATSDQDLILGFMVMLMSIIFFLFMMLEERKQEVEDLRHKLFKVLSDRHN